MHTTQELLPLQTVEEMQRSQSGRAGRMQEDEVCKARLAAEFPLVFGNDNKSRSTIGKYVNKSYHHQSAAVEEAVKVKKTPRQRKMSTTFGTSEREMFSPTKSLQRSASGTGSSASSSMLSYRSKAAVSKEVEMAGSDTESRKHLSGSDVDSKENECENGALRFGQRPVSFRGFSHNQTTTSIVHPPATPHRRGAQSLRSSATAERTVNDDDVISALRNYISTIDVDPTLVSAASSTMGTPIEPSRSKPPTSIVRPTPKSTTHHNALQHSARNSINTTTARSQLLSPDRPLSAWRVHVQQTLQFSHKPHLFSPDEVDELTLATPVIIDEAELQSSKSQAIGSEEGDEESTPRPSQRPCKPRRKSSLFTPQTPFLLPGMTMVSIAAETSPVAIIVAASAATPSELGKEPTSDESPAIERITTPDAFPQSDIICETPTPMLDTTDNASEPRLEVADEDAFTPERFEEVSSNVPLSNHFGQKIEELQLNDVVIVSEQSSEQYPQEQEPQPQQQWAGPPVHQTDRSLVVATPIPVVDEHEDEKHMAADNVADEDTAVVPVPAAEDTETIVAAEVSASADDKVAVDDHVVAEADHIVAPDSEADIAATADDVVSNDTYSPPEVHVTPAEDIVQQSPASPSQTHTCDQQTSSPAVESACDEDMDPGYPMDVALVERSTTLMTSSHQHLNDSRTTLAAIISPQQQRVSYRPRETLLLDAMRDGVLHVELCQCLYLPAPRNSSIGGDRRRSSLSQQQAQKTVRYVVQVSLLPMPHLAMMASSFQMTLFKKFAEFRSFRQKLMTALADNEAAQKTIPPLPSRQVASFGGGNDDAHFLRSRERYLRQWLELVFLQQSVAGDAYRLALLDFLSYAS